MRDKLQEIKMRLLSVRVYDDKVTAIGYKRNLTGDDEQYAITIFKYKKGTYEETKGYKSYSKYFMAGAFEKGDLVTCIGKHTGVSSYQGYKDKQNYIVVWVDNVEHPQPLIKKTYEHLKEEPIVEKQKEEMKIDNSPWDLDL